MMHTPHDSSERGFTILLAALVASLVLTLGISVFSVAQKQLILSSLGRSSQYAFYAADSAAECALYWDIRYGYFSTSTPSVTPTCDTVQLTVSNMPAVNDVPMEFQYETNGYCAQVTVVKRATNPHTVIHADGFSTACSEISSFDRTLQRSVELQY